MRRRITAEVPGVTGMRLQTMTQVLAPQLRPWRLGAELFAVFGLLALVVASVGIYSVVSYTLSQRTREMGIRIALGARDLDILTLVLRRGIGTLALGIALGLVIALAMTRFVASLLFGVSTTDPASLLGSVVTLGCLGLVASLVPGWRATRVDPMSVLRSD